LSRTQESVARNAGRGGIAVLGAKVFFILTGLVQQTLLPRAIGLAGYGALARVLAPANILNNVIVASSTQGVSRAVARAIGDERRAFLATLRVHVVLALVLSAGFAGAATGLASFEGAPYIVRPLLCMAVVLFFYGLYAPMIGFLNGRGQFSRQAMLDVIFAVLRTAGLLGVGWLFARRGGSGVFGSTLGFALAAVAIVPLAATVVRKQGVRLAHVPGAESFASASRDVGPSRYLAELGPLAAAQFFTNAVMQVDILLLGHFLSQGGDAKSADEWVAVYRACQLFAFLPYQLLLSITQVLFPMLARAKAEGDLAGVRRYVERGARLALIVCGMLVTVIVALPSQLLAFAYARDVADRGAAPLRVLALGQGAYAILAIATTVLASLGRERLSAWIMMSALVTVTGACTLLAGSASFGAPELLATATGTSVALLLALVIAGVAVRKIAGGFIGVATTIRVLVALAVVVVFARAMPTNTGRGITVVLACVVATAFIALLVVSGELTRADAEALRKVGSTD
jgi:stage V sporulation protein B